VQTTHVVREHPHVTIDEALALLERRTRHVLEIASLSWNESSNSESDAMNFFRRQRVSCWRNETLRIMFRAEGFTARRDLGISQQIAILITDSTSTNMRPRWAAKTRGLAA
jgi:hypothetical protein